jgi:hypothetical protein
MRSFTILSLMGYVVILAVGLAALRNANAYWAGAVLAVTLILFLTAVLGAIYSSGQARAGWLGFSIFGFAYLSATCSSLLPGRISAQLPTSELIYYVHEQVKPTAQAMSVMAKDRLGNIYGPKLPPPTSPPPTVVPTIWNSLLPRAADHDSFASIGHCLFGLMVGLLGAFIARWFEHRRTVGEGGR